jgi:Rieske Fe-S protein
MCDGSRFDVSSGGVLRGPATLPLATYEVRERGDEIQARLSPPRIPLGL